MYHYLLFWYILFCFLIVLRIIVEKKLNKVH